ncbi:hypothetical protein [Chryseobacterium gregarium]|uniref:hypothetical protein n=1 Tax=Chryseobacterium gregarium TaxID=456299 RepID=UPI0004107530|nr:hypothetical protein [Chryseobacterium gregarium]
MRILYFITFILFFSCSRSIEDRCFAGDREQTFKSYIEKKPFTVKQILEHKPGYLDITDLTEYRTFRQDSTRLKHLYDDDRIGKRWWDNYQAEYKVFTERFSDRFLFSHQQQAGNVIYALARNELGFWLCTIENDQSYAYFLGLSFSHYYINDLQQEPMIENGFLQLQGSLVKMVKVPGLPGYDDYSAISDGKLFTMSLENLTRDSDHDGYNDIFEQSFGLNPDSKDTDGDGISDFDDLNPMFISGKNKFTQLYELMLPAYAETPGNLKTLHYTFTVFESDCDYFHQVSPDARVLFIPESDRKKTGYVKMTDVTRDGISKIKRSTLDENLFYISTSGSSFENEYSAEYRNGKWVLELVGGIVI